MVLNNLQHPLSLQKAVQKSIKKIIIIIIKVPLQIEQAEAQFIASW